MRMLPRFGAPIASCALAGILLARDLFVPCITAAQGADFTLVSGQQLIVRLVAVRVNASTREIEVRDLEALGSEKTGESCDRFGSSEERRRERHDVHANARSAHRRKVGVLARYEEMNIVTALRERA